MSGGPPPVAAAPHQSRSQGPPAGWVRRLWGYMLRQRSDMVLSLVGAVCGSASLAIVPLVERQIIDHVILHHSSPLAPWLILLIALAAAGFAFAHLRRYRGGRVALGVQYALRCAMHDHLQGMDAANLGRMPTGQLVARANSDATLVQGLLNFFPTMSSNVLLLVFSLGVMLALSPLLALVSLLITPAVLILSYRMRRRVFPASWDGQQREGDVIQIVDEDINGVRVVKAFGQEQRELERVTEASVALYGSQMRAVRLQARFQPMLQAMPALGQVAILALGGWLALHHRISLGTFLAFSSYMTQMVGPAQRLAGVLTIGQQARAGVERIFQLLDLAPAIADAPDAVELPAVRGDITFADIDFSYGEAEEGRPELALAGFDLEIKAGERVALVGPSGSGKSTAALLLSRFYDPDRGMVSVDGHDLAGVTLHSLRRQIGVVFEESFLFSESVRANIAYGRPDAGDPEIEAAARIAQAHEFIEALPRGYDTVVGERGLSLSGGQRQRIALARAILTDPRILILDDATSAIDARIEAAIHDGLRDVMEGRTTLLVAHRRSTLHLADRIVVVEGGRVVETGTHEELARESARYRSLLSGLEEADTDPEAADGRIEALATITASAWAAPRPAGDEPAGALRLAGVRPASVGSGLRGGGGGRGGWRMNLAPTPELLARVAALPPIRDTPTIDLRAESRQDRSFSLGSIVREFRRPLLVGLALVVLDALASLLGPVLIKSGVDSGVRQGSEAALFLASGIFLVVTLADLFNEVGETFITGRAAQRIMLSLRIRIWAQLQRLSLDYYENEMSGRIMTRMTTDVDQFESLIENGLLSALVSLVTFVGVGIALLVLNPTLGAWTLTVVVPLAFATVAFRRRAASLYDLARERVAVVNADFQESIAGIRESQAFVHEDETIARFHRIGRDYLEARVAAQRLVATYFPFVQFLSGVADAVVLGVGAGLVASGHLAPGALIAFILYIDLFFSPIQQLSQVFDSWQQTRVSVSRISDLMQLDPLTPAAADPEPLGRPEGSIALDDVHFTYPAAPGQLGVIRPERPRPERQGPRDPRLLHAPDAAAVRLPEALRGIDLAVRAGETVALVGETGAGKSTVMKLVARFYDPTSGAVRLDGRDLRRLDLTEFRSCLGYVPQESFLFTGSIRDNIAYGRPEADDADVEAAARAVGAHDFIAGLPGGYHHQLAERGRSLSAGQRQLIALARASLVHPAVLLLDEATANLDLATEARVAAAMARVSSGRTTIVIAHRLQTAKGADRIVVLDHGQVVEVGSHEELLTRGGRYATMWEAFELLGARGHAEREPA
ncbi:MAG: ABC transporter ATP-binding protein/permease [Acidimicrobiaceae bacterium]|nr:ABC transporter ATP-binding protein/permease [Acidimicrobiaceae bacterium]